MRPRSRQRAVVVPAVILALFSTAKTVGAAQQSWDSLSTTARRPYPNGPCTVSAGNGDEIVGRLILSPSCRMPRGAGPFPPPPAHECLDCIPVADGYDGENFVGVEEAGRWGEEVIVEHTTLEEPQAVNRGLDKQLALAVADATKDAPVVGAGEEGEKKLNSLAGKIGEVAAGIFAAVAAAAAAAVASVFTGALTEAEAGTLSESPQSSHGDAFGMIAERSDSLASVLSRREPGVQEEGQDAARLRGAGGEFRGRGWRDSAAGVGDAVGPGVSGGDEDEAAEVVRRKMQEESTPTPTAVAVESDASVTVETDAPAAVDTDAPADAETDAPVTVETEAPADAETDAPAAVETDAPVTVETEAPGAVETDAPADAETDAPAAAETDAPASVETDAPVEGETPVPTPGATPDSSSEEELTITPTAVDGVTPFPSGTRAPGETPAPSTAPTPSPTDTVAPSVAGSVSPTASLTSSEGPAASASPTLLSTVPSSTMPPTPTPTNSNTSATEEALETTGDVASGAVAVGVATTAAVATVTTVTAVTATTATTTAATTTAATGTVTSTLTTTATTAASAGTGGGTSSTGAGAAGGAATGTGTTTTTTTAVQSGTQTVTSANTSGVQQTTRVGVRSNVQSNTGQGTNLTIGADQGSYVSARSPSASLGLLMILQIQFVSLLRLLEANITEPFMNFLDSVKWLNLHFEVDVTFLKCNDEDVRFSWSNDDNGTWALNTFLVFGCLILLILFHILALSYLEASWLAQANAIHRHRLELMRQHNAEEAAAPVDGSSAAAYERYLDAQNQDRELYEQEMRSAERYLRRHNSAWLYFPHIELLFLLFAYQGASAAEARMIYSGCFPIVVMGVCAMVIFPVFMLIYVNRIVWSRLRSSNSPLIFRPNPEAKRGCGCLCLSLCCVCNAWKQGTSMFAWADKGEWISKNDEDVDLDSRKFRIGFEPLFVDYTQRGTLYISYLLFEWLVDGLVSGFVTDGTLQTGIIFVIYFVDLLILVGLRPFANSMIQCITTMTVLADVLTVALMCYASLLDEEDDSERLEYIYAGALVIQTSTIIFFVVPLYLDSFIVITSLLCTKIRGLFQKSTKKSEKPPIKGSCGETTWIFFALVRENFVSCVKSTWRGPKYNPDSPVELERRQSTLLQPISETNSEDELSFSYRGMLAPPSRVSAHQLPSARNPHHTSDRNALQDFSDHGSNNLMEAAADDGAQHQRRVSRGSAGRASRSSRGPSAHEREPPSERR